MSKTPLTEDAIQELFGPVGRCEVDVITRSPIPCDHCEGTGKGRDGNDCKTCDGNSKVILVLITKPCDACDGWGFQVFGTSRVPCAVCHEAGCVSDASLERIL